MQGGMGKLHKVAGKFLIVGLALVEVLAMSGCSSGSSSTSSNQTATPAFSPGGGSYTTSQTVTISDTTQGAVLYCTTDGTTPTTSSPQCSQPTTVFQTEFLQAIAVAPNLSPSAVVSAGYTIGLKPAATPTFSPAGGTYTSMQAVTINDTTTGANIYYTTDGTVPAAPSSTSTGKLYTGPVTVSASETLSAIAEASGYSNSAVASAAYVLSIPNAPTITSLSPASAVAGGAAFTLTVNGTNFVSGATVQWGSTALTTTFVSATQLTAAVPASLIANAGSANVTVTVSGSTSTGATFTISPAALPPTITSLSPASTTAGGAAFTLTISGTNFDSGTTVQWGTTALARTYVSATQLTAVVPANLIAAPGSATVTVTSSGGTSAGATFTITAVVPTITSLSPTSTTAGGSAFTLTVNGTNFVSGATVQWGSTALTTTYVSATQLTAAVPASLIATAGSVSVTVKDSGGTSPAVTFTTNSAVPTITSLSPTSITAGGAAFTLTVNGTNFLSGATVQWGSTTLTTTFVSSTQLTAAVPASLIANTGSATVTVTDSAGTSSGASFSISAPGTPTITNLAPTSTTAGGSAFTLTVNGTNFVSGATVEWGSSALTTTFVSTTQLTAAVPASLIATAGTVNVTVTDTAGTSSAAPFTVSALPPTITSLSPASAAPGGVAFTLTVNGTNFDSTAVVQWDSTALTTTYVSTTQLTAAVPASLIAAPGSVSVTVTDAGDTSSAASFTIALTISGKVMSGPNGINGATVQLYAAGTSGYGQGSGAVTTAPSTITTDSSGNFTLLYTCPTAGAPGDQMYLVATGGDSGSGPNTSIALMAGLGTCSNLPSSVTVNEVTTIASAYALSAFATVNTSGGITVGAPGTGSSCNAASGWQSTGKETCNYTGLVNAFKAVNNLVNIGTGTALTNTPDYKLDLANDPNILNNSQVPTTRINALADMLASCVESSGSDCSSGLFNAATTTGPAPVIDVTPVDTLQAALNIAQNPGNNVSLLLGLVSKTPPYSISSDTGPLSLNGPGAPVDLTLALTFTGGGLGVAPNITLQDGNLGTINGGLAIDAAGNIWVGASLFSSNTFATDGLMIAEFNALGVPLTSPTTLSSATTPVPTYGGYNPEPKANSGGISSLAIDQSGNLWTNDGNSNVLEINTKPSLSLQHTVFASGAAGGAIGLAIDSGSDAWFIESGFTTKVGEVTGNGNIGLIGNALPVGFSLNSLAFDYFGGLWAAGGNASASDLFQLSTSNGSLIYDAFSSSSKTPAYSTTLAMDGAGNVYGCDPSGLNLDVFNTQASTAPSNLLVNTFSIATQRACGSQLVLDGNGHLFASLMNGEGFAVNYKFTTNFSANIDEFTTGGALISPQANGYTGSSSTEAPTLNPDPNYADGPVIGVSAAIDGSGNLWVLNNDTFGPNNRGNELVEFVGIGAPVVTPAATALTDGMLGVRP